MNSCYNVATQTSSTFDANEQHLQRVSEPHDANVPELVEVLRAHAAPIAPPLRSKFFELVDRELGNVREIGPGILARTCARAQREFVAIPDAARPLDGRR